MSPDGENDIDGVGVPAPVQGRAPVPGRSAMDGVGEKAPSVSVGLRGSKKMCRFGVSGVAAPGTEAPKETSWPHVTRPGVYVARPGAGPGAGAGAGA